MADNNSKKPMALLLLVVVAVLVVILMTPTENCTLAAVCEDTQFLTKAECEESKKVWTPEQKVHVPNPSECAGTYWDFSKEDGCLAAGKTWTAGTDDNPDTPEDEKTDSTCK